MGQTEYQTNYQKENLRQIRLKINRKTEPELLAWIEKKDNIQGYLKKLISEDMKKEEMKMFKVNQEYADLWGENPDDVMSVEDVEMIARGWEKSVDDVIDQLEVYNFKSAEALMDDEIREELNAEIAPCTEARFMWEYYKRHKGKFGEEFKY